MLDLTTNNRFVSLSISDRSFSIPMNQLYIKREQIYILKCQGISQILENDIYNVTSKSDIIAKIRIV